MANVHYEETRPAGALPLRPTPILALLALGILALLFAVATGEPPASAYKGIASQAPSAQMVIEDWRGNSARLPVSN